VCQHLPRTTPSKPGARLLSVHGSVHHPLSTYSCLDGRNVLSTPEAKTSRTSTALVGYPSHLNHQHIIPNLCRYTEPLRPLSVPPRGVGDVAATRNGFAQGLCIYLLFQTCDLIGCSNTLRRLSGLAACSWSLKVHDSFETLPIHTQYTYTQTIQPPRTPWSHHMPSQTSQKKNYLRSNHSLSPLHPFASPSQSIVSPSLSALHSLSFSQL
jgi:hypothetical protein